MEGQGPARVKSLEDVLREVGKVVRQPKPAPNQTVDFFIYMNRVAMSVGVVVGSLTLTSLYLWYARSGLR